MSIEKLGGSYTLECDICGEKAPRYFDYFDEAVDYKKENGWKSKRDDGGWWDHCPECQ